MKHWRITNWCNAAVAKIYYPPDRKAVFEELRQHLDERSDYYLEQGYEEKEAVEKTLEVMGNATELAPMLGAIHRPFWGFAYSITKVFAAILAIATLVLLVLNVGNILLNQEYTQPYYRDYNPYVDTESEHANRIGLWEQSGQASFGGYTYSLEKCALWHCEEKGTTTVHAQIRITNYLPWAASPDPSTQLEAMDNLENRYSNMYDINKNPPYQFRCMSIFQVAPFVWLLETEMNCLQLEGLEWIDICSRDSNPFVLRIDLTGGGSQ